MDRTLRRLCAPLVVLTLGIGPAFASQSDQPRTESAAPRAEAPLRLALNWDQIAGDWKQFKGKARQQWGKLTDDDVEVAKGRREELVGKIQERYGITKEEANRQVDAWMSSVEK